MQETIVRINDKSNEYSTAYHESIKKVHELEEILEKNISIYISEIERLNTELKSSIETNQLKSEELKKKLDQCKNENSCVDENWGWPVPKPTFTPIPLNLEFFPNLLGPYVPPPFEKSLVVCTTGESGKELVNSLIKKFGLESFSYVFFLYDKSNWDEFEWFDKVIWVRAHRQVKFWYIQRFITPALVKQYQFLWIIDDDVGVELIDPFAYQDAMRKYGLQWTQPANIQAPGLKVSHFFTIQVPGNHIGRYSKFVEIGPLMVFTSEAWNCGYSFLQADISCGWGYDLLWYDYCKFEKAAIIDKYPLTHHYKGNLMAVPGRPDPTIEKDVIIRRFGHLKQNYPDWVPLEKFG